MTIFGFILIIGTIMFFLLVYICLNDFEKQKNLYVYIQNIPFSKSNYIEYEEV